MTRREMADKINQLVNQLPSGVLTALEVIKESQGEAWAEFRQFDSEELAHTLVLLEKILVTVKGGGK